MARTPVLAENDCGEMKPSGWFNPDKATWYEEYKVWNGRNYVGQASGGQLGYEELGRTAGGRWVLYHEFTSESGAEYYRFMTEDEAQDWMVRAGVTDDQIEAAFPGVPEERGPGQPRIGAVRKITIPDDSWAALRTLASSHGVSRAELVRQAISAYLNSAST